MPARYIKIPEVVYGENGPKVVLRRWRVMRKRLPQNQHETTSGACDWAKRTITIHTPVPAKELLATLVHESIHATAPDLTEAAVERIEESVVAAVWPYMQEIYEDMVD